MAKRRKSKNKVSNVVYVLITLLIAFSAYLGNENLSNNEIENIVSETRTVQTQLENEDLKIYYLNVGQADSILIQNQNKNMLIDAGNNGDGDNIVKYLKELQINKIDILVGTHPHEDHIGGLDDVIDSFEIGTIYMPKVATTTKTFEDVLDAIESKELKVTTPEIDSEFSLGDLKFKILWTSDDEDNLNSSSIVLKMTFDELSYIFAGDAEAAEEKEIIKSGYNIEAQVLKLGHHGSSTSSSEEFLDKVSPSIAIIMTGEGNSYGHPHKEVLERLEARNIKVYRTDTDGTILITSDGKSNKVEVLSEINLDG